jgi:chromosome segregation ATPase
MSEDSLLLIRSLKERVREIFSEFERVEKVNAALKNEISTVQQQILELQEQLAGLTKRYENLKLAKGLEDGLGDHQLVRHKINKLVREIDKCVALLNE